MLSLACLSIALIRRNSEHMCILVAATPGSPRLGIIATVPACACRLLGALGHPRKAHVCNPSAGDHAYFCWAGTSWMWLLHSPRVGSVAKLSLPSLPHRLRRLTGEGATYSNKFNMSETTSGWCLCRSADWRSLGADRFGGSLEGGPQAAQNAHYTDQQ